MHAANAHFLVVAQHHFTRHHVLQPLLHHLQVAEILVEHPAQAALQAPQPERLERQQSMAAEFEAETGIGVEVIPVTESDLGTRATAAFAASGAWAGIRSRMDMLGVLVLGIVTATGDNGIGTAGIAPSVLTSTVMVPVPPLAP